MLPVLFKKMAAIDRSSGTSLDRQVKPASQEGARPRFSDLESLARTVRAVIAALILGSPTPAPVSAAEFTVVRDTSILRVADICDVKDGTVVRVYKLDCGVTLYVYESIYGGRSVISVNEEDRVENWEKVKFSQKKPAGSVTIDLGLKEKSLRLFGADGHLSFINAGFPISGKALIGCNRCSCRIENPPGENYPLRFKPGYLTIE